MAKRNENGRFIKGQPSIRRGAVLSDSTKDKISIGNTGKKRSDNFKDNLHVTMSGSGNPFWGKKHTEETKEKIRKNHPLHGLKGSEHPNWKGGLRDKEKVLDRDAYTCRSCGLTDQEIMEVDHIIPVSIRPDLRRNMGNMQSLCPNCHARKTVAEWRLYKSNLWGNK